MSLRYPVRTRTIRLNENQKAKGNRQKVKGKRTDHCSPFAFCLVTLAFCLLPSALEASNPRRTPVVEVVERVRSSVVNIHSERTLRNSASPEVFAPPAPGNRVNGMGTGVIVDPRGYIITNQHVVEDVNSIRVRLSDGTSHAATLLARDTESDLALLKIDAGRMLQTVPLGTATDLMVGETVVAIGNAYGYEHTVTVGVVSAVKRDVTLNKEITYKSLIQTDASINPGNSGGPLLNINGEMVGINVAIRAGAQGISFAIPVDTMIRVTADLLSVRKRRNLWHGLVYHDNLVEGLPDVMLSSRDHAEPERDAKEPPAWKRELVVDRIEPASPALQAGLLAGDVVVKAGEKDITNGLELERALLDRSAGDKVLLVVRRKGVTKNLDLVLQSTDRTASTTTDLVWRRLGMRLQPVNADLVVRVSPQLHGGMMVVDVEGNGLAEKSGIQRGDILVGLHQWETLTVDNVAYVLTHPDLASFNPMSFFIIRSGQVRRGWLRQEK
jgi:serine protease Do